MSAKKQPIEMVLCGDRLDAEQITVYLKELGYHESEINRLLLDKSRTSYYLLKSPIEQQQTAGTRALEGMGLGGAIGTALVGTAGAVWGIGMAMAVPSLGWMLPGPVVAGFFTGGLGAAFGGFVGLCTGAFVRRPVPASRSDAVMIAALPSATEIK